MPVSTLFVGIDVSLKTNQVCSINFNQDVFFNHSFDNSPSGTEKIIRKLLGVLNDHPELTKIHICLEATNVYHIHVSSVLSTDARLLAHGVKVFAVNAKLIEKYKETFVDRSKMLSCVLITSVLENARICHLLWAIKKLPCKGSPVKESTLQSSSVLKNNTSVPTYTLSFLL